MGNEFLFSGKLWAHMGMSGNWHFISLPKKDAAVVKKVFGGLARGWGSLRIRATIGNSSWTTSIFPDAKRGTYLLPIKAGVRKSEALEAGRVAQVKLRILL